MQILRNKKQQMLPEVGEGEMGRCLTDTPECQVDVQYCEHPCSGPCTVLTEEDGGWAAVARRQDACLARTQPWVQSLWAQEIIPEGGDIGKQRKANNRRGSCRGDVLS